MPPANAPLWTVQTQDTGSPNTPTPSTSIGSYPSHSSQITLTPSASSHPSHFTANHTVGHRTTIDAMSSARMPVHTVSQQLIDHDDEDENENDDDNDDSASLSDSVSESD